VFLRSAFSPSTLTRLLDGWAPVAAEPSGLDTAERLGLWVSAFDAIRLQAAHQAIAQLDPAAVPRRRAQRASALAEDVQRTRSVLLQAIAQEPGPVVETALTPADLRRLARAAAQPQADEEDASSTRWRQRHLELQRQMELMLPPLREHVRQALAQGSSRLRRLAALDAAMDQVLAPREQKLLPTIIERMERRFTQLREEHRQALQDSGQDDAPAAWRQPGGWLARFAGEWRQLLAAELELRLQPVTGLLEAAAKEWNEQQ
ncbi:MAG TPA: DUF3348 family protein, partial [Ramlibacter sp.]|uniref:DUF3348 family protein n=1 Tax=Ramlibacter sp. TaxID=1917967 RepID=UPI002D7F3597